MVSIKSAISKVKSGGNPFESGLVKLKIIGYELPDYTGESHTYTTQFNPTKIRESVNVQYVENPVQGTEEVKKLGHLPSKVLNLELTLDGTGVSGATGSTGRKGTPGLTADTFDVLEEIKSFKKATYDYIGTTHDIPHVQILWGNLDFKGRLTYLTINHILFKSSGNPLRSVINASFDSSIDPDLFAKKSGKSSPDLTHTRIVQVGDTLPLMCQRIYNDSSIYLKVAKFNNLVDFRNLDPGMEIIFPPLI